MGEETLQCARKWARLTEPGRSGLATSLANAGRASADGGRGKVMNEMME